MVWSETSLFMASVNALESFHPGQEVWFTGSMLLVLLRLETQGSEDERANGVKEKLGWLSWLVQRFLLEYFAFK